MVAFRQMRFRFSLCDGVLKQHLLKLMETAEWCYLVEYSFHVQESSLWTGYWKSSKCFCKGVYIKVGYASSKMPVEVSQPCQPELESVSCFSFLLQKVLLWDLSHHFSTSRVSSTGAGGTKFNPQLGCWPWASLPQPPMYGHQVPVLPEWKVLGKKPYSSVDAAQERINPGPWCSFKHEKQIIQKFMAFWQFELAFLSQVATSLKVNMGRLVNACPRQKSLLSGLPGDLFNW